MTTQTKFYRVGGCVRDKFLGVQSKDVDFAVECSGFDAMRDAIKKRGGEIFVETPKYLTIRAKVPKLGACDYVLCRKDSANYADGRRPDFVEVGTIFDDLNRRDFCCNAIAEDADTGEILDPHNGRAHIEANLLACVGDTATRFNEDRLRILRAIRFHITRGFNLHADITSYLHECGGDCLQGVSTERIREELLKCFETDTNYTLRVLGTFPIIREKCFDSGLILKPTIRN